MAKLTGWGSSKEGWDLTLTEDFFVGQKVRYLGLVWIITRRKPQPPFKLESGTWDDHPRALLFELKRQAAVFELKMERADGSESIQHAGHWELERVVEEEK